MSIHALKSLSLADGASLSFLSALTAASISSVSLPYSAVSLPYSASRILIFGSECRSFTDFRMLSASSSIRTLHTFALYASASTASVILSFIFLCFNGL